MLQALDAWEPPPAPASALAALGELRVATGSAGLARSCWCKALHQQPWEPSRWQLVMGTRSA